MKVSMICAMARNRVIGTGHGGIPWRLPRDSRHFRSYTQGHHMLLGRKTFEEMTGWFTTQTPIVLTRRRDYHPESARVVHSVPDAIEWARRAGDDELVVSGGASVYQEALPYADELVLTLVAAVDGQTRFPDYETVGPWDEIGRERIQADDENEYAMSFVRLRRRCGAPTDAGSS
jgi:dihydrofolate reductase